MILEKLKLNWDMKIMAKAASIHPKLKVIKYITLDGTEHHVLSTLDKDVLQLEIDRTVHQAWVGASQANAAMKKDGGALYGDVNFLDNL